jgi:hypothetical protein
MLRPSKCQAVCPSGDPMVVILRTGSTSFEGTSDELHAHGPLFEGLIRSSNACTSGHVHAPHGGALRGLETVGARQAGAPPAPIKFLRHAHPSRLR